MDEKGGLSLNTATVRDQWNLAQCIEGCARHGFAGISPWRDKLQEMGVQKAAKHIRDAKLRVSGLCRGGMLTYTTPEERLKTIEDNKQAIDEAAALGAECLVMVCGGLPAGSRDIMGAREMIQESLAEILPYATAQKVPLALEPLHPMTCADRSVLSSLGQAVDWCETMPGLSVALDVYHVWWDVNVEKEIKRAGNKIAAFHVCDWLVPTTHTVFDRGMPGEGVIEIPRLRRLAQDHGYKGLLEIEILSYKWWEKDPEDVLKKCMESYEHYC